MAFEDKPLSSLTEADIRQLITAERPEGLTVEYKAELYESTDRGNREFLLDVCMFANASGGVILIGIPEARDGNGRPTGIPDRNAELGVTCEHPEQLLTAYESRLVDGIDERLTAELTAIPFANGRFVLAIRIPNSLAKPHRVRYQNHSYFPCRRERHRYELNAREIKDLAMRTASQSERAENLVAFAIDDPVRLEPLNPVLICALLPVFTNNFVVDLKNQGISQTLATFPLPGGISVTPHYSMDGLRRVGPRDVSLAFAHNGLLKLRAPLPARMIEGSGVRFYPTAIDLFVRSLVVGSEQLFERAKLTAPALLGVSLWTNHPYVAAYGDYDDGEVFPQQTHKFPILPLTILGSSADNQVRQLSDLIHQTFGVSGSPAFGIDGTWQGRRFGGD
jgi:hypothetical protein